MAKFSMQKDPRVYARGVAIKPPEMTRALGVDLGTNCGIAFCDFIPGQPVVDSVVYLEQWDLSIGTYDSTALRHIRLQQFLSVLQPDLIGFEDVKVDVPIEQFKGKPLGMVVARIVPTAEFLGTLKITLSTWAERHNVPLQGIAITEIKKFATGKGNSGKEAMILACNEALGVQLAVEDYEKTGADNIADAAHILRMMIETYSEGLDATVNAATEVVEGESPSDPSPRTRQRRARNTGSGNS
jgi:hypothetical protein